MTREEIMTNISRIKKTISLSFLNKGYIENLKKVITSYEVMLKQLI